LADRLGRLSQTKKKGPKQKESLLKLPQAVEINKGGLRRLLLDDFHNLLEKASAQNAAAFSQFQQALLLRTNNPSAFGGGNLKPETALTQTSGHTLK